jgi:hypothetical protein
MRVPADRTLRELYGSQTTSKTPAEKDDLWGPTVNIA